jgi:transcription initiation factor TFIIH subunit 1
LADLTGELQKELKELYVSLSEILKHFWAAFPPSSPELVQKTNRMIDALHKFNQVTNISNHNILPAFQFC